MILLHGNGRPGPRAGPSQQLLRRIQAAADYYLEHGEHAAICFFARDRYPNGVHAKDVVEHEVTKRGIPRTSLHIDCTAGNTYSEVQAFLEYCRLRGYEGPLAAVTSHYHRPRSAYYFHLHQTPVRTVGTHAYGWKDCMLEPLKLAHHILFHPQDARIIQTTA